MPHLQHWKMCVSQFTKEKRVVTFVSICGLQRQSNKGKCRSNEVVKSPRQHIEGMKSHDKTTTIQTWTFQYKVTPEKMNKKVCATNALGDFAKHNSCLYMF